MSWKDKIAIFIVASLFLVHFFIIIPLIDKRNKAYRYHVENCSAEYKPKEK